MIHQVLESVRISSICIWIPMLWFKNNNLQQQDPWFCMYISTYNVWNILFNFWGFQSWYHFLVMGKKVQYSVFLSGELHYSVFLSSELHYSVFWVVNFSNHMIDTVIMTIFLFYHRQNHYM